MKLKDKFIVHNMGDEILLVSADDSMNQGFIRGNSTAAIIIEELARDVSEEAIIDRLEAEFDAPREVIAEDVREVLTRLEQVGALQGSEASLGSIEDQLRENGRITYRITGDSMLPLLRQGSDWAVIAAVPEGQRLKKYDVILYKRKSGQYVLHRIVRVKKSSYVTCGDNRYFTESGVDDLQILGVLECVLRNGERIAPTDAVYISALEKRWRGRLLKGIMHGVKRKFKR